MQFLIEQLDPSACEVLHRAVVKGRSGVLHAAGELAGPFGVFRFAPAG